MPADAHNEVTGKVHPSVSRIIISQTMVAEAKNEA
jgi:hypothetical protein